VTGVPLESGTCRRWDSGGASNPIDVAMTAAGDYAAFPCRGDDSKQNAGQSGTQNGMSRNVPQMERPGFDEFLRLGGRTAGSIAVRSRTGRNELMHHSRNWVDFRRLQKTLEIVGRATEGRSGQRHAGYSGDGRTIKRLLLPDYAPRTARRPRSLSTPAQVFTSQNVMRGRHSTRHQARLRLS
jgi:hypothetical protein